MKHGLASKGGLKNDVSPKGLLLESMEGTLGKGRAISSQMRFLAGKVKASSTKLW